MYYSRNVNLFEELIPAHTSKLIRLPINPQEGEAWISKQVISYCVIHDCVTLVNEYRGIVEIWNPSPHDVIFSTNRSVDAEIYNDKSVRPEQPCLNDDDLLSHLGTEHLNAEERANLDHLCARNADVLYVEEEAFTFTNKIKYHIGTTDKIPIYSKRYRYPFIHREEVRLQVS